MKGSPVGIKVRKPKGYRRWCVVIDYNGQRKTKVVGAREAAERVKREIEARLALGDASPLQTEDRALPTLAVYSKDWLDHISQRLKPGTVGYYSQYLRLYVLPKFGDTPLDGIERDAIKKFISELAARSLAKNTIRLVITALRAVLSGAIEDGLIDRNPAQRLGRFVKSERPEREAIALTAREVERLLAAAKAFCPSRYPLFLTAVRAGLREGELPALRWGDIQFGESEDDQNRYILVQRNYDRRWSRKFVTTKSRKPRRVDMSRELRRELLTVRDQRLLEASQHCKSDISPDLVFPSEAGTVLEMNNLSERVFKPLLVRAGLRNVRFHDLRHTYGSLLIQTGASLAYVRDQMGHSSIQVTVDIYGHLIPGANVSYVDRLDSETSPPESARRPQESSAAVATDFSKAFQNQWLGGRDSNPDTQIQSLQSYR